MCGFAFFKYLIKIKIFYQGKYEREWSFELTYLRVRYDTIYNIIQFTKISESEPKVIDLSH